MMVGTADAPTVRPYDEVQEDGPVDFEELLTDLRSQLVEDAPERDTRTRTELAAELKEMGLLDDAIRELQAAIREPDPPPEAFELLGEAFLEKGKPRIAARLLASALDAGDRGDREFLGVLYQLGIAYEQLREPGDALECYERIFSVNIDYRDIQARIQACST